jgi:hypothetical protein
MGLYVRAGCPGARGAEVGEVIVGIVSLWKLADRLDAVAGQAAIDGLGGVFERCSSPKTWTAQVRSRAPAGAFLFSMIMVGFLGGS